LNEEKEVFEKKKVSFVHHFEKKKIFCLIFLGLMFIDFFGRRFDVAIVDGVLLLQKINSSCGVYVFLRSFFVGSSC
jgi:hypothetical protein